uniref:hypothetical protein n=1 Tax=Roseivirga sp. TaxID=1964215 RepID=UPI0040486382
MSEEKEEVIDFDYVMSLEPKAFPWPTDVFEEMKAHVAIHKPVEIKMEVQN